MQSRTDSREELKELFEAAKSWHTDDEITRLAIAELLEDSEKRRELGPHSLGPLAAVALQHPDGHEAVLLGSVHTAYFKDSADNPVPGAVRHFIRALKPCLVVGELDEGRAEDERIFPSKLRGRMPLIHRKAPEGALAGGMTTEDPVMDGIVDKLQTTPMNLKNFRKFAGKVWKVSGDGRLFQNHYYLLALEAAVREDFGDDIKASCEASAELGVPLVLGDLPQEGLMTEDAVAGTSSLFAERRRGMLAYLRDSETFLRFERSKRRLMRSTMTSRGGADLDLFGRCVWLLEPIGAGYQSVVRSLTDVRDPYLAAAFSEPEALKVLRSKEGTARAVAVLGNMHLPGVAKEMEAAGWKRVAAPSGGWPDDSMFKKPAAKAKSGRAQRRTKKPGFR